MADHPYRAVSDALERLRGSRLLPATVTPLRRNAAAILTELRETILAEIPAYTESRDPATLRELAAHAQRHQDEIVRLLEGGAVGDFGFVREHAQLRAEHRFPLEAVLHAYRCAHRVYSRWLREAASSAAGSAEAAREVVAGVADFSIEYIDAISTIASAAYVDRIRLLADVAGDERAQLLNILLGGFDESDARVASILRRAGYLVGRQAFCVVLAQSVDATEMENPARVRRLADTLDQLVPPSLARRLIDVRDARVVGVFSAVQRLSGWTAPSASLAERLARALATAGNAVLIGVSGDVTSTSRIPAAHRQALLALRMASVQARVVEFAATPLRQLMIHLAGDELQRLLPAWAGTFYEADDKLGGTLSATLRAYADADMNLLKAAARLEVHPNTLYARLNRIREITGLNARGYFALTDLLTVADARTATRTAT
ncbi:MAG TPA: helix-turn-helix domain-containing protein [Burkholderiales bacterium]